MTAYPSPETLWLMYEEARKVLDWSRTFIEETHSKRLAPGELILRYKDTETHQVKMEVVVRKSDRALQRVLLPVLRLH